MLCGSLHSWSSLAAKKVSKGETTVSFAELENIKIFVSGLK